MTLLQWLQKLIEEHKETNVCLTKDEFVEYFLTKIS